MISKSAFAERAPQRKGRVPDDAQVCPGWCPTSAVTGTECELYGLDRLRLAFRDENCPAAVISRSNAELVAGKFEKLSSDSVFVFFRGAAAFFDIDMMCDDPLFRFSTDRMPRVTTNGDCHPENFGTMMQANSKIVWGVNDFDQSFKAPFGWDVKRGATGFMLACTAKGWELESCHPYSRAFVKGYVETVTKHNCSFAVGDRFVEGGAAVSDPGAAAVKAVIAKARSMDSRKASFKWISKYAVLNSKGEVTGFRKTAEIIPLPPRANADFQEAVEAYLYHGVPALARFPASSGGGHGKFWTVEAVARKTGSGTGSIGLDRFYILIRGRDEPYGRILLEMKQEVSSVLEQFFKSGVTSSQEGERGVFAERGAFPYTNLFYGWVNFQGKSFIIREKSKHSKGVKLESLDDDGFLAYARLSGVALSQFHLRVRCPDHECLQHDAASIDLDTCHAVSDFLQQYWDGGPAGFVEEVVHFSEQEAKRHAAGWDLLRKHVDELKAEGQSLIELLHRTDHPLPIKPCQPK